METFRRYEKKYLLDESQYRQLLKEIEPYIKPDRFYSSKIRSIYYDTDNSQLIRHSIEKPEYKEKLRIRSYDEAGGNESVFVEFKKKLDGIVYKRRTKAKCQDLLDDIYHCDFSDAQIGKEIKYALNYYDHLSPAIYIGCERTSYVSKTDDSLRITFDRDISYRTDDLALHESYKDKKVTDKTVMELKISDAMPLWLADTLDEIKAYPQGFSKVGTAYLKELEGAY